MRIHIFACILGFSFFAVPAEAESFRTMLAGILEVSAENPRGSSLSLPYDGSVSIMLGSGVRFFRGVEIEISAPQIWLSYRGSLAMLVYAELDRVPVQGVNDIVGRRIAYDPLPGRIKIVYQIPVRAAHGLRSGPYAAVPSGVIPPSSFPVVFKLMPIIKGLTGELENIRFTLNVKPILSDEGAVRLIPRYPEQLWDKPFTVLINDVVVENLNEEQVLREGEHHLVVLSDDYRNISSRFVVERAKVLDLTVDLLDSTSLIIFEGPENASIFLNNDPIPRNSGPVPVEPGIYEAKFIVGDYTKTQTFNVQRGKTYKAALAVGIEIEESE